VRHGRGPLPRIRRGADERCRPRQRLPVWSSAGLRRAVLAAQGRLLEAEAEARRALLGTVRRGGRYSVETAVVLSYLTSVVFTQRRDPVEVRDAAPQPAVHPTAGPARSYRDQLLRSAHEAVVEAMARRADRRKSVPSRTDFFPEKAEWAVPAFVPEEVPWPRAALEKQEADFQFGYSFLRGFPREMTHDLPADRQFPRQTAGDLDFCLPYFLTPWCARPLARITPALQDSRTPRDVRKALAKRLRDIVRGDRLREAARPGRLPQSKQPRVSPEAQASFRDVSGSLGQLCKRSSPISAEDVVVVLRQHLPDGHAEVDDTRRETLDGVLKGAITPHIKLKMILRRLFDISERHIRKLIYGWGLRTRESPPNRGSISWATCE
jgi:hypothetical protein